MSNILQVTTDNCEGSFRFLEMATDLPTIGKIVLQILLLAAYQITFCQLSLSLSPFLIGSLPVCLRKLLDNNVGVKFGGVVMKYFFSHGKKPDPIY